MPKHLPSPLWCALALGAVAVAVAACGDDTYSCTTELRTAVVVKVSSDEGLDVDRVTAGRRVQNECHLLGVDTYNCFEQGGGKYVVRVFSGSLTWTRTVSVDADRCHVDYPPEELAIELEAATAD
jgi:hypothetical protein